MDTMYCPICIGRNIRYPMALLVKHVDLKKKPFRRNVYTVRESFEACSNCDYYLKRYTTVRVTKRED